MIGVLHQVSFVNAVENNMFFMYDKNRKEEYYMDAERQHQEDLQRLRGFRLMDDDFMNACLDDNIEGTELILRIILQKPDIKVTSAKTQRRLKNLLGRDVCLDVDANDASGKKYDIEVQRANKGADRKRARYHSSMLDAHLLKPGDDYADIPETYVIFITEHDVIGGDLPIYTIERVITNMEQPFNDGEHIIYVNGEDKDSTTELGKLMHDFSCTNADDMYYDVLAKRVKYFKEDERGVEAMCKVMEDMRDQAKDEVRIDNAITMLKDGLSEEKVAQYSGLSLEKVKKIAEEMLIMA